MKKFSIIHLNIIICLGLAIGILSYTGEQRQLALEQAEESFLSTTELIGGIADNYFDETKSVCSTWVSFMNGVDMNMEQAIEYLKVARVSDDIYAQIIWADTYSGFSRESYLSDNNRYTVDYIGRENLFAGWDDDETMYVTPRFTNPTTGSNSIAICGKVFLLDEGAKREAIVMRILPNSYLSSKWAFPSNYDSASIGIIDEDGQYVLKPDSMKNDGFYSYLYSYNQKSINQNKVEELVKNTDLGVIKAKNSTGVDCFYGFKHLDENEGWVTVVAVPAADIETGKVDLFIPAVILVTLLGLLIVDIGHFKGQRKADLKVKKQLEEQGEQLKLALDSAEYASRAKTDFLNNMSHDIRTPMNAIIGFTTLAASHIEQTELVKDYLKKILSSSEHLLSLINDVLDMSRIESGKVKIEEKETSLPVIMHDLRNILQTDMNKKHLDFYLDCVDVKHENIVCDKLRLNQVLINLMSNAIKFTDTGGTVGLKVIEFEGAPEGYADYEFHVKDTGIGMSEEFAEHIFEPFSREENSTVSKIEGTGLGLAITKNIVDMMNGQIKVSSKKGVGTEFVVSLRFKTSANSVEVKTIKRLEGFRALVADDNMDSCTAVAGMLKTIGLRPEWTTLGKEAVYRAKHALSVHDPFHVYIIDWLMPDMNGVEVVRRIRKEIGNDTPIIVLTAYDWSAIEEEAKEAGVTAFCAKPIFLSELYNILQNEGSIPEAEEVKEIDTQTFRGKRVLLVDDVELNREIAVAILEEVGIEVETAVNGKEAVDKLLSSADKYYDLVLMDVMMPIMDGYEATRTIRKFEDTQKANIPIIAMTANAFDEDKRASLDAGMNDHLSKPFKVDKLIEVLHKYLA